MIDLEAEKRLALTFVLDPVVWDYCADLVTPAMFGSPQARAVVEGVQAVVLKAQRITPVAVQAAMVEAGGAGSVVPGWAKGTPLAVDDAKSAAARIRELWTREVLSDALAQVAASAGAQDSTKSIQRVSEVLKSVEAGSQKGAQPIGRLVLDFLDELEQEAKNPTRRVFFETGFKSLDDSTGGLMVGELSVFAARPGNGKSSFVMALACNLAARGIPVGVFWMEDDSRDFVRRFLARRFAVEAWRFRGSPKAAVEYIASCDSFIEKSDLPIFVDDTHGLTITDITARMRRMKREHGCRIFILDHMGEVRIERDQRWGDRHDLSIGIIARQYRDTAKELDAVPILVSQMNRQVERRDEGSLPRMSDLDGSGQVEQAARHIAFVQLYRDDTGRPSGKGMLHLVKCSGGSPGSVELAWDGAAMTWRES